MSLHAIVYVQEIARLCLLSFPFADIEVYRAYIHSIHIYDDAASVFPLGIRGWAQSKRIEQLMRFCVLFFSRVPRSMLCISDICIYNDSFFDCKPQ